MEIFREGFTRIDFWFCACIILYFFPIVRNFVFLIIEFGLLDEL